MVNGPAKSTTLDNHLRRFLPCDYAVRRHPRKAESGSETGKESNEGSTRQQRTPDAGLRYTEFTVTKEAPVSDTTKAELGSSWQRLELGGKRGGKRGERGGGLAKVGREGA
jgi:hypothetical protein